MVLGGGRLPAPGDFGGPAFLYPPKDALGNSVAALSTVVAPLLIDPVFFPSDVRRWWIAYLVAVVLILFLSIAAMTLMSVERIRWRRWGEISTRISGVFGSPGFLFTALFLLSLGSFHQEIVEVFWLSATWIVLFLGRPLERTWLLYRRLWDLLRETLAEAREVGTLLSRREPGIVTIEVSSPTPPKVGALVMTPLDDNHCQLATITDTHQLPGRLWVQGLVVADRVPKNNLSGLWAPQGLVMECPPEYVQGSWLNSAIYQNRASLVGVVTERSDIDVIQIELTNDRHTLREGQLLTTQIADEGVLYQIINGVTESELLEKRSRHGFVQIAARKLGKWNADKNHLEQVPWVPRIYTPVYYKESEKPPADLVESCIGHIPGTGYGIAVSCDELVTHNTAILGVLGTGKTCLALELIVRLLAEGTKVWVFDITGEYEQELADFVNLADQRAADGAINLAIKMETERVDVNQSTGGNHPRFRDEVAKHIKSFMEDPEWRLRVIDPYDYDVTEQSRGAYQGQAAFNRMTPTQITRIVTEEMLRYVQYKKDNDTRICVVFEEAHSLVPERNAVAYEGDKTATNATAKAILQGRKYGLGCLLITQRTAHVTKSILNQCNTVFALQTFDKTGMDFLANYIGEAYTSLLASLPPRCCVAYGKALNAQSPLLMQLNDRDDFVKIVPAFEIKVEGGDDDDFSCSRRVLI